MTETIAPPQAPAVDAVTFRLAKLERQVKRLNAKVRRLDRENASDIEISPEWEAEIERRLKEADENPGNAIPWDVVKAELRSKYGFP